MPSFPQTPVYNSSSASVVTSATFGSNVTAGNLIFVVVMVVNPGSFTVTDNLGNTYTLIQDEGFHTPFNDQHAQCYYAKNVAGGACTVTAAGSPSTPINSFIGILCAEIAGLSLTAPLGDFAQTKTSNVSTTNTFNINDSLGTAWTIQCESQGGPDYFGAVDFTNLSADLLLYYDNLFGNSTTGPPSTLTPVAGGATLIFGASGAQNIRLWQLTATPIPFPTATGGTSAAGVVASISAPGDNYSWAI
jgi:hypothetical protein